MKNKPRYFVKLNNLEYGPFLTKKEAIQFASNYCKPKDKIKIEWK